MTTENRIDNILNDLVSSGSNIPYLKELRTKCLYIINRYHELEDVLFSIISEVERESITFINKKNTDKNFLISGLSTGIYFPDSEYGSFKYILTKGYRSRSSDEEINFNTLFDVASITKLYTLLLAFKLEELGLINLDDKVKDVNPDFKHLDNYTFNDLIKLFGELRTDGNIVESTSYEEAQERFKSLYIVNDDKTKINYNDFGSMVIGDTIEKIISNYIGKNIKLDEIMYMYLFRPLNIKNTCFTPKTNNLSGNGYSYNMPHDPKSRMLGGITGHAGIFTNSEDLMKLSDGLFMNKFLNEEHLSRLSEANIENAFKGNMGLFLKHPLGYEVTFNPMEYSNSSFTAQGWTGGIASFDLRNKIHNNILVNAIIDDDKDKIYNNKPIGFSEAFDHYQINVVKKIMLMFVMKKYYNKYCDTKEEITLKKSL